MTPDASYHTLQKGAILLTLSVCFVIINVIQRLVFHPLRKFPGPWLAAVTGWYETYHEAVLGGTFVKQYGRWHKKYGE